jgi:thymidylate synthase
MWWDYNYNGRSDFMCTNAVQYMIRDDELIAIVQMRSNDVYFGYRNDYAFQDYVVKQLAFDLGISKTKIVWQVGSLHIYERHFKYVK